MVGFLDNIEEDGLPLLWTLLNQYHGTAAQIIQSMRIKIDSFRDRLKLCHGDIDNFLDRVRKTMEMLKSTGGSDDQAFDKIYKALVETHVTSFNETICVWNIVMDQSGLAGTKSISALRNKARTEYQSLCARKKWTNPKKRKSETFDIISLLAKSQSESRNETKSMIKAMMAMGSSTSTRQTLRVARSTNHSWESQYGKGKYFPDKSEFLEWVHKEPENTSNFVQKNGIKWYWCLKCERFTSHKTAECTRKVKRSAIKVSTDLARKTPSVDSDDASVSESDESTISTATFDEKPKHK